MNIGTGGLQNSTEPVVLGYRETWTRQKKTPGSLRHTPSFQCPCQSSVITLDISNIFNLYTLVVKITKLYNSLRKVDIL